MSTGHFTEFEDEYLETLYSFNERKPGESVRTGDLAEALNVSPASVTEMVQRLASKGLVIYQRYRGASLTEEGLKLAAGIKRKHRLMECFLYDMLRFRGDIHDTACRLEHAVTDELESHICELLGHPTHSPSGAAIPPCVCINSGDGNIGGNLVLLSELPSGGEGEVSALLFSEEEGGVTNHVGLIVGAKIGSTLEGFTIGEKVLTLSTDLQKRVVVRRRK